MALSKNKGVKRKLDGNDNDHSFRKSALEIEDGPIMDFSKPLANDALEKIFSFCTRDDLDNCKRACKQWYNVIEDAGRRLPQREISVELEEEGFFDVLKINSVATGKKLRVDMAKVRENLLFDYFNDTFVPCMVEKLTKANTIREKLKKMVELGGSRIRVKKFIITIYSFDVLREFKEYFPHYVDTTQLVLRFIGDAFSHIMIVDAQWRWIDFGLIKKVKVEAKWAVKDEREVAPSMEFKREFYRDTSSDFYREYESSGVEKKLYSDLYKEFFSCSNIEFANRLCLSLTIDSDHLQLVINYIVESLIKVDDPTKYFKKLILKLDRYSRYSNSSNTLADPMDSFSEHHRFVLQRDEGEKKLYWLAHPTLKAWRLEAMKTFRCLQLRLVKSDPE